MPVTTWLPEGTTTVVSGLLILVGIIGVVVPVLPGLLLAVLGVVLWASETGGTTAWVVVGLCVLWYAAGTVAKILVPGRRLKGQGVGSGTLFLAVCCAVIGLFVIPVVGAPIGFVLGIYLVEYGRRRDRAIAWRHTTAALRAVLHSIGIELVAGFAIAVTWLTGVVVT